MDKITLATVWLCGCSGCHMSFLDLDEWLFDLAEQVDLVFSPVGSDLKTYPPNVDLCLVEGGVANSDDLHHIRTVRERTRLLVSFGDCAVTANVPGMRNPLQRPDPILRRAYLELADSQPQIPQSSEILPVLLPQVLPVHEVVSVDYYLPGCPPDADRIRAFLEPLLRGEEPDMTGPSMLKFG